MHFLSGKLCTILIAAGFLCASTLLAIAQQQPGPAPQHLELKDPTPRPPDLEKVYGTGQADQAKQQQAAMLKKAQVQEQVVKATDKLCRLAQELHDNVAKDASASGNAAMAAQIEKLAKSVREKMQMQ